MAKTLQDISTRASQSEIPLQSSVLKLLNLKAGILRVVGPTIAPLKGPCGKRH